MFTVLRVFLVLLPLVAAIKFGDREIFLYRHVPFPWEQAFHFCRLAGQQLVTIQSVQENAALFNMLKQQKGGEKSAFIGASYSYTENEWVWGKGGDTVPDHIGGIINQVPEIGLK